MKIIVKVTISNETGDVWGLLLFWQITVLSWTIVSPQNNLLSLSQLLKWLLYNCPFITMSEIVQIWQEFCLNFLEHVAPPPPVAVHCWLSKQLTNHINQHSSLNTLFFYIWVWKVCLQSCVRACWNGQKKPCIKSCKDHALSIHY